MTNTILSTSATVVSVATALVPVPYVQAASTVLAFVIQSCEQVKVHKDKARQLVTNSSSLLSLLQDQAFEKPVLQGAITILTSELEKVYKKVFKISQYNELRSFIHNRKIEGELESCSHIVELAIEKFKTKSNVVLYQDQKDHIDSQRRDSEELLELLRNIVDSPKREMKTSMALNLMFTGKQEINRLWEATEMPCTSPIDVEDDEDENSDEKTCWRNGQIDEYYRLLEELNLPLEISCLNGETIRKPGMPKYGGPRSDIYIGLWKGKKVALKYLRNVTPSEKALRHFKREILVWSRLSHENILPFYGLTTDYDGKISIVSQWQENRDLFRYCKKDPGADRLMLLYGAAKGIAYLHSNKLVHGNLRCSNILISADSIPSVCDFGLTKNAEDVTETSTSVALAQGNGARWAAPELMLAAQPYATRPIDVYAFAMTVLECLTLKEPFAEFDSDVQVVMGVIGGKRHRPARPLDHDAERWISDKLWAFLCDTWVHDDKARPGMKEVLEGLRVIMSET